jgi:glycosyltransferase involved in cell wall biosynthesis
MNDQSLPLVSILMPTFNGAGRIKNAIESVIAQSYQQWELLVIDDGSTDAMAEIIRSFSEKNSRIRYSKNEKNLGIQKTLNRGLREAKGEYIARIDDDDRWSDSEKLEKQIRFFETHPDHVLVGTGVIMIDEQGKELLRYLLPEHDADIRNNILGKNCFVHSSVMFKKSAAKQMGGYDESKAVLHVEDYDLWLKLGTVGKFANLPLYAVTFTLRQGGLSSQNRLQQSRKIFYLVKKYQKSYPHYFSSMVRAGARIIVYGYILRFPLRVSLQRFVKLFHNHPER